MCYLDYGLIHSLGRTLVNAVPSREGDFVRGKGRYIVVCMWSIFLTATTVAAAQLHIPTSHDDSILFSAITLRASIGRSIGQPDFNPQADLNGDGTVNALDVALFRQAKREGRSPSRTTTAIQTVAGTERIIVEMPATTAFSGQTVSVLFLLRDNTTPLSSYTVDVDITPESGAVGTVTANAGFTNFFDQQNFITASGATRDPFFSVIADNGTGGVSVTTNTDDFSTVQAVDDVNDVLAQVFFDVPLDAVGDFTIQLTSSSALIDGNGASVSFTTTPGTIRVIDPATIPTVSEWGVIVMCSLIMAVGTVVFGKNDGLLTSRR